MAISKKERCAREIMQYADQVRNMTMAYTVTKKAMHDNGFADGEVDPITDEDLVNLNLTSVELNETINALDALGSLINGEVVESANITAIINKIKWWAK